MDVTWNQLGISLVSSIDGVTPSPEPHLQTHAFATQKKGGPGTSSDATRKPESGAKVGQTIVEHRARARTGPLERVQEMITK